MSLSPPRNFGGPDAVLSQNAAESPARYGVTLSLDRVRNLEIHIQGLVRTLLEGQPLGVVDVIGNWMAPTLCDGDWALVDHSQRELQHSGIFVLDGPLIPCIRRARKEEDGWWGACDNPAPGYDPVALRDDEKAIGRVMWWVHAEQR